MKCLQPIILGISAFIRRPCNQTDTGRFRRSSKGCSRDSRHGDSWIERLEILKIGWLFIVGARALLVVDASSKWDLKEPSRPTLPYILYLNRRLPLLMRVDKSWSRKMIKVIQLLSKRPRKMHEMMTMNHMSAFLSFFVLLNGTKDGSAQWPFVDRLKSSSSSHHVDTHRAKSQNPIGIVLDRKMFSV